MNEMEVIGVRVELPSNTPIVLLKEVDGEHRVLPIFIGGPEATAIALALDEVETPRPMTHDLTTAIVDILGAELVKVVVTDLRDRTFFAEMTLRRGDDEFVLSARPSDALALAVRAGCPVYAADEVLDQAAQDLLDEDGEPDEEVVEEFRAFIDQVNPEDFES
jgi:bifunctional DNase/RNase